MIQVHNNFFRGPRPKTIEELVLAKIQTVISLQSGFYQAIFDDRYELEQPLDYNIRPFVYPMSDLCVPNEDLVIDVIDKIRNEGRSGRVYVHCKHGVDRTGYITAAYRLYIQDWTFESAVKEMLHLGFHKFPYFYWINSLKRFEH